MSSSQSTVENLASQLKAAEKRIEILKAQLESCSLKSNISIPEEEETASSEKSPKHIALSRALHSGELLRQILDLVPHSIFMKDREGRYLLANKAAAKAYGCDPSELIGSLQAEWHLAEAELASMLEADRYVIDHNEPVNIREESFKDHQGNMIYMETSKVPFSLPETEETAALGVAVNITHRRKVENALRESEQRFRAIANHTYDWEDWVDTKGKLIWINPAVKRIAGYSVEECMNMPDYPLGMVFEDDKGMIGTCLEQPVEQSIVDDISFRVRRKDGQEIWVAACWQPIFDDKGNCLGRRSSFRDITKRRRAMEALRQSEQKLQVLFDVLPVGVAVTDDKGIVIEQNRHTRKFFDVVTGSHVRQFFNSRNAVEIDGMGTPVPEDKHFHIRALKQRETISGETIGVKDQNGKMKWFSVSSAPIPVEGYGILLICHDITARKSEQVAISNFKKTLDALLECLYFFDPQTLEIQYANAGAEKKLGFPKEKLLQMSCLDILEDVSKAELREKIDQLISGHEEALTFAATHTTADKQTLQGEVRLQFIEQPGAKGSCVAIFREFDEK